MNVEITPWIHQAAIMQCLDDYPKYSYFFLIGGYGCGKSFAGVLCILKLQKMFNGYPVTVGIGGTSQTLLRLTLLSDLFKTLNDAGMKYVHNKQEHTIQIGTVKFIYINCSNPDDIYAYNFSAFIFDELDELPQQIAMESFKAVQERNRVICPDGRKPIFIGLTTAQGLRGAYHITRMLTETKNHYILVRGLTKNNKALDPSYVERLYSLYSPEERLAFLEGRFVNLYTGRVYKDFDERSCLFDPRVVTYDWEDNISVGQDLNSGFSKGSAVFEKEGIIYIVGNFSFDIVGDAPRILRNTYVTNPIDWYPDASSKEIMAGYKQEIFENNITLHMSNINPPVNDRILIINKMFKQGKLKVSSECKDLILALKTRQFDKDGNPEKGKGPHAPDHICDATEYVVWNICKSKHLMDELMRIFSKDKKEEAA
jgi:hypothetical protein